MNKYDNGRFKRYYATAFIRGDDDHDFYLVDEDEWSKDFDKAQLFVSAEIAEAVVRDSMMGKEGYTFIVREVNCTFNGFDLGKTIV